MQAAPRQTRLRELDGLRGAFAIYVVFFHLSDLCPDLVAFIREFVPLWRHPGFAVDMFFVLSGVVMSYVYRQEFAQGVSLASYRSYFSARVARIYPVHLFLLLLLAPAVLARALVLDEPVAAAGRYGWWPGLASLFMLHGPWVGYLSWNYPAWSISAEFHAYVLFPFVLPRLSGVRRALPVVLLGTALAAGLYAYTASMPTNGPLVLLRVLPLFFVGVACHSLPAGRLAASGWTALVLGIGLPATLLFGSRVGTVFWAAPLVYLTLHNPWVARVFRIRPFLFLGEISYSLYMVHAVVEMLILARAIDVLEKFGVGHWVLQGAGRGLVFTTGGVLLSLLAAWALLNGIERPLRERVRRALAGEPAAVPALRVAVRSGS